MNRDPVSAFVVGRHPMYRRGLAASLAELPGVRDVREADTPADALPALAAAGRAVTVVDHDATRPPGELRTLCAAASGPVLLCLVEAREDDVVGWVEDGVVGFLEKDTLTPEVLRADVQAALAGSGVMAPDLLGRMMDGIARASHDVLAPRGLTLSMLTARERRVLALLADGASTREVAVAMCYSERTVKAISHDIATKFGARTRTQAVARAVRAGII